MSSFIIFGLLIALMLTGMPISIALGLTVLTFIYTMTNVPTESVALKLFTGIDNFEIMAIPFFILAGNFLTHGGVARRMINFATSMVGHWYGGLGLAGVMACALFAAVSGSSPATVIAIGAIMMPAMVKQGFPKRFGAGVITTSGALGILIPPSIVMVIYCVATGGSVALDPVGRPRVVGLGRADVHGRRHSRHHAGDAAGRDDVLPRLEIRLSAAAARQLDRAAGGVPEVHVGTAADPDRARRHLCRPVHPDRGRGDQRGLCLRHRGVRLQGHEARATCPGCCSARPI